MVSWLAKKKVRASEVERKESSLYFLCRCVLKVYGVKQKFDYNDPKPIGFRFLVYFSRFYQSFYPQTFQIVRWACWVGSSANNHWKLRKNGFDSKKIVELFWSPGVAGVPCVKAAIPEESICCSRVMPRLGKQRGSPSSPTAMAETLMKRHS